jgi:hypothetical protein
LIARIVPGQSTVTGARKGTPKISTTSRDTTRCSGSRTSGRLMYEPMSEPNKTSVATPGSRPSEA